MWAMATRRRLAIPSPSMLMASFLLLGYLGYGRGGFSTFLCVLALLWVVAEKSGLLQRDAIERAVPRTAYWSIRMLLGLLVLSAVGLHGSEEWLQELGIRTHTRGALRFGLGMGGFLLALTSISPLMRSFSVQHKLGGMWGGPDSAAFLRASNEEQVTCLLLAVAQADGYPGERERLLVRQFVLARFPTKRAFAEIDRWIATAKPPRNLELLAKALALRLASSECATVYSWCCLIAFADGGLHQTEFQALQAVAKGFAIPPRYAQFLFDYAQNSARQGRSQSANDDARGAQGQQSAGSRNAPPPPRSYGTPRERALQTLGLPSEATKDQIRQRHRELVRKFHPDAHQRLGPVAQQEAAERFKSIQRAYEELAK